MRFQILILLLILTACTTHESIESLGDYDVTFESDVKGKIYTYQRFPGNTTITHHFKCSLDKEDQLITQTIYVNDEISSERVFRVSGNRKQLEDEYYYEYPSATANEFEKVKGDIITYKEIDDGKKYKGLKVKISFTNSIGFRTTVEEEDTFSRDTTILWQNVSYNALIFRGYSSQKTVLKYFPFVGTPYHYPGNSYYAKGIGLIKLDYKNDNQRYSMNLVSIERIK